MESQSSTVWPKWDLYKVIGHAPTKKSLRKCRRDLNSPISVFQIPGPPLPQFNTASSSQKYNVIVTSKKTANDARIYPSLGAVLRHEPKPAPDNPYKCSTGATRKVQLDVPWMVVNRTSNTSGDGDRDELYFEYKWKKAGDGGSKRIRRLTNT